MIYRATSDGKKISLLGYGAMRLPTVDGGHANGWQADASKSDIDQELLNRQVKYMLEHGVNYFDTSPGYCRGDSEKHLGVALAKSGFKREDYVIATKMSNFSPKQYPIEKCRAMFENSLKMLKTDYIDNYLLHSVGDGKGLETFRERYLDNGALDWLCELRRKRKIRNLGFSFHGDAQVFEWMLENHVKYHWDFAQIQMNYIDWLHAKETNSRNLNAKYLYDALTERGIPVVIMEPLLGGKLARYNYALARELAPLDPEASLAKWAFRFCGSFDNVITVLSGMTFTEHIEENVSIFNEFRKLSEKEFAALERAAKAMLSLNTIPCTACSYCMPCPYGLDIPAILQFRNHVQMADKRRSAREILELYARAVPEARRRADHCIGCERCVSHCPQSINIPSEMAAIDAWIDEMKSEVVR